MRLDQCDTHALYSEEMQLVLLDLFQPFLCRAAGCSTLSFLFLSARVVNVFFL